VVLLLAISLFWLALDRRRLRRLERRREALERRLQAHDAFLADFPASVYTLDAGGRIVAVGGQRRMLLGWSRNELLGMPYTALLPPDELARASRFISRAFAGESLRFQTTLVRRSGEQVAAECTAVPLRTDGQITGVRGTVREVSPAREPDARLRASEERLRTLFEHSLDGILLNQPDGRILAANPAACRLFGRSEAELIRLGWRALVDESAPSMAAYLKERARNGQARGELVLMRGDGSRVTAEVSARAFADPGGDTRVAVILRDLSERREAESRERESRDRYRSLFELSTDGVYVLDREGRFLEFNRGASRLTGYAPEEVIGEHFRKVLPGDQLDAVLGHFRGSLAARPQQYELDLLRRDGSRITVELTSTPIVRDGEVCEVCGIVRDVTERRRAEQLLDEGRQRFRSLFDNNPDAVYFLDRDGRFVSANASTQEITGHDLESLRAMSSFAGVIDPADVDSCWNEFRRMLAGELRSFEFAVISASGERHEMTATGGPVVVDGETVGISGVAKDITVRRRAEEQARIAANALDNMVEGAVITDPDWRIVAVNRAFTRISGYSAAEVLGKTPPQLGSGGHNAALYREVARVLPTAGAWQGEIWHRRKNGERYPALVAVSAVRDDAGRITHYVAIFNDMSRHRDTEARLEFLSYHDALTRLANRALLLERGREAVQRARRRRGIAGLLLLDLDQFKTVNDSLGHDAGDALLKQVAERLLAAVRESDTVARVGGDEFAVLLDELDDNQDAGVVAQKVIEVLSRPFEQDGGQLFTSASVGISCYPHDGGDMEALLKHADAALYRAKELGRNTYQYASPEINAAAAKTLSVAGELRRALERDELVLHFQPCVELAGGRVIGAEALVRWQHPERGLVGPGEFIPIAEQTGLIGNIGEWVLRAACAQARAWEREGLRPLRMAVNLSPRQFRDSALVDRIARILAETGLDPARLDLEITEGMLMEDPDRTARMLAQLHALGPTVAIDDFGTGYSSLNYLKQFVVDYLKIDQSFVSGLPGDPEDLQITRAIIGIAQSLGIRLVAEGIETDEQAALLREAGCTEGQGFLYAPALPADSFTALLYEDASLPRGA